jgi:hypothetical protein
MEVMVTEQVAGNVEQDDEHHAIAIRNVVPEDATR